MKARDFVLIGLTAGGILGWLAFDPPSPHRARAFSLQPPTGRTGAPGEGTCAPCHSGGGTLDGSLSISAPAEYEPGLSYTIVVALEDPGQSRWGFELIPTRKDPNTGWTLAGSLTNLSPLTTIQEPSAERQYISHTSNANDLGEPDGTFAGTVDGPVAWSFTWTAPPAGSDTVTFYAAGIAANNNGNSGAGDFGYTATAFSVESGTSAVQSTSTTWGKIKKIYR